MTNTKQVEILGCVLPNPKYAPGDEVYVASSPEYMQNENDIPVFKGNVNEVRYSAEIYLDMDDKQTFKVVISYEINSMLDTLVREESHVYLSNSEALIEAGSLIAKFVANKDDALKKAKDLSTRVLLSLKEESNAIRS
tara:strand:- start:1744 stop:2157 length:414 start_codon:yes stop_codon:yes gene_type:complete